MLRSLATAVALPLGLAALPASGALAQPYEKRIEISRATVEHEWPFSVDEGELSCFIFAGRGIVFFREPDRNDPDWFVKGIPYDEPRSVIVSTNPLEIFVSLEDADLFLPFDSDFAVLIRRLMPFVEMGQSLCRELRAEIEAHDPEAGAAAAGEDAGDGN